MAEVGYVVCMLFAVAGSRQINHPGYKGCYWDKVDMASSAFGHYADKSDAMTVERCLQICKDGNASLAGLRQHDRCYCGETIREARNCNCKCSFNCSGNGEQYCGGSHPRPAKTRMSVYNVSASECPHPGNPAHGAVDGDFWFGSEVTFRCDVGFELHGNRSAQCTLDESGYGVTWSGAIPACLAVTSAAPTSLPVSKIYGPPEVTTATTIAASGGDYNHPGATHSDAVVALSVGLPVLAVAVLVSASCGVYAFKRRRVHKPSHVRTLEGAPGSVTARSGHQAYVNTTYDASIVPADPSPCENMPPLTPGKKEVKLTPRVVDPKPGIGNEVGGYGNINTDNSGYQLPAEKCTNPVGACDEGWVDNIIYESSDTHYAPIQ